MQLAEFALTDCQGLVLAHRQNFTDGSLAKGTILTTGHLAELGAAWQSGVSLRRRSVWQFAIRP